MPWLGFFPIQGASASPPDHASNADCAGRGIPTSKIGVQQFTYLPVLFGGGTAEDVTAHMASLGMRNIERFGGTFGLTLEEYDQMWDDYRVRPVASHGSLDPATWDQTLADAKRFADVGEGTTDWAEVFRAATDVKYCFIEYDIPPDAYASVEDSYNYLTCLTY